MTISTTPALDWARRQTADSPIRWKSLEIAAFSPHRRIVRALGPTREEVEEARRAPRVPWWTLLLWPVVLVTAALVFYPALAFVLLADGWTGRFDITGIDARLAVPIAGSVLAVGAIFHVVAILRRRQREKVHGGTDSVAILFGLADAVSIGRRGSENDVTAWPAWLMVAILVVAVGALGLVRERRLPRMVQLSDDGPRPEARRLVARLSDAERDAVRIDLAAAIDDLAGRDLISADIAGRARAAELAMLSITVNS